MSQRRRRELAKARELLAELTRVDAAKRVADELRVLQVHAFEHVGPLLHIDQDKTPGKRTIRIQTIDALANEGGVVITQYEDDPPELRAARDAKLRELRARGLNPPVVIINSLASRFEMYEPRNSPRLSPPGASSANPQSSDPCLFEENR